MIKSIRGRNRKRNLVETTGIDEVIGIETVVMIEIEEIVRIGIDEVEIEIGVGVRATTAVVEIEIDGVTVIETIDVIGMILNQISN